MTRKKIVLVIVEGPSDDEALGLILNRLYDKNVVVIEIMHGDITADYAISPNDIVCHLGKIIKAYADKMHYKKSDFQQVIHIVDMDGAFVPDSAVIYDINASNPIYSLTTIKSFRPKLIIERNHHKQSCIVKITKLKKVWGEIPYQAYYMSRNLDHVLYDKLSSTDKEKERDAYEFSKRYKDDIDGFLSFISDSEFSKLGSYKESWDFIKENLHSLERFTNLGLCFEEIRKKRKTD